MRLKTVLHRVHPVKGFVYEKARLVADEIEITVRPRWRSRPVCFGCGHRGPGYDTLPVSPGRLKPARGGQVKTSQLYA